MYQRFSEKLEKLLRRYNDQWDQMLLQLEGLRDEIDRGRGDNAKITDPFSDLIAQTAFGQGCLPQIKNSKAQLTAELLDLAKRQQAAITRTKHKPGDEQ